VRVPQATSRSGLARFNARAETRARAGEGEIREDERLAQVCGEHHGRGHSDGRAGCINKVGRYFVSPDVEQGEAGRNRRVDEGGPAASKQEAGVGLDVLREERAFALRRGVSIEGLREALAAAHHPPREFVEHRTGGMRCGQKRGGPRRSVERRRNGQHTIKVDSARCGWPLARLVVRSGPKNSRVVETRLKQNAPHRASAAAQRPLNRRGTPGARAEQCQKPG
jgi:hypothetical protein